MKGKNIDFDEKPYENFKEKQKFSLKEKTLYK
jgi:hypothetical protein